MRFIRIGICALVVFGVASHGAVEDWARAVLEIGAALLFFAWAVRAYLTEEHQLVVSPLLLPLVALLLLVLQSAALSFDPRRLGRWQIWALILIAAGILGAYTIARI